MSEAAERGRVAYLLTQDRGGPVDVAVELVAAMKDIPGWEARLFGPAPARGGHKVAGLHTEVRVESKGAVAAMREARAAVLEWEPDVVHAQDRRSGLLCATFRCSPRPAPVLVHTYHGVPDDVAEPWFRGSPGGGPSRYTRAVLTADAAVARLMTRTVVPSSSMGRFLEQRLHVPAQRVVHIDNGMPLPHAAPPSGGPVRRLLFIGLLVRRKGVHALLEAMSRTELPPDVVLQVVGDGPERAHLEHLARELGLESRVAFLGFRSDVPELIAAADALVLPSEMEQQPLVLIEAMGAGKPAVVTDVGGVAEMVADAGIVVPPKDTAALARALSDLTGGVDAPKWGARAAMRARERFSVERSRDRHCQLYDSLLGHDSGSGT